MKGYTKEELVDYIRWHSNAPISAIRKASIEALEQAMTRSGAWEKFYEELPMRRECLRMEQIKF